MPAVLMIVFPCRGQGPALPPANLLLQSTADVRDEENIIRHRTENAHSGAAGPPRGLPPAPPGGLPADEAKQDLRLLKT